MNTLLAIVLITVIGSPMLDWHEVSRVERLAHELHIGTKLASWTIHVVDLGEFQQTCPYAADEFETCSDLKSNTTYVNADWLVWGVTDKKLKHVLAHEAGHLISGSADESVADKTGAGLE
jgi:hypothetical protein